VAVYNASAYLKECLDSLLNQTLRDIQIICIDDCSTDNSLSILHDYMKADPRIEVIHLDENHGQAFARNEGLKQAKGEYVCFLDADDWYSCDALEQAVNGFSHEGVDTVLFNVSMDYADHSEFCPLPDFDSLSGEEAFRMSLTWQIHGVYMVRTSINQRFPYDTTCRLYSDDNTTRLHYLHSRRVGWCRGVYHYRQHSSSATHQVSVRRFDYLKANESMKSVLLQLKVSRDILSLYENHRWLNLVGVYMFYFVHGKALKEGERQWGLQELHRTWATIDRTLLDQNTTKKFGYRVMPTWTLFRLQEWLYFTLRGFLGKNV
jgi:glycosyltransferase involved in cell wall biosynthesis